ncbi:hypothetical protein H206_05330 [Candidatus Electrothrix aarhusensis]|uniref:Uncharacterized protein n=1 Tax=Candidatus Electrothrix aarhusensis TaxID=1859131 RepID=A0A444J4Z6_9BACT|nr:hypothetical protein H206_05330 [Candidatus Electrothrix aarhusensis]
MKRLKATIFHQGNTAFLRFLRIDQQPDVLFFLRFFPFILFSFFYEIIFFGVIIFCCQGECGVLFFSVIISCF